MKIVNLFLQVIICLILIGSSIYFLTGFDSAFEADQSCHAYLSSYNTESVSYGCDHDTETHQWILYKSNESKEPAKIIKKFRYKFL